MTTPKTAYYPFNDEWAPKGQSIRFGIVRCPENDVTEYERLAKQMLDEQGITMDEVRLAPPRWEWLRMNVSRDDDYAWMLGRPAGPGPGNFRGVIVQSVAEEAIDAAH